MNNASPKPWLTIVIVAFDSGDFTRRCVSSLQKQTDGDFQAVIVVNGDEDGGVAALSLRDDRFTIQINAENNGFAGGSNQVLMDAQTDYVMTLNPDTELALDCLARLRAMTRRHSEAAMLCPVLTSIDGLVLDSAGDTLSAFGIAWNNGYRQPVSDFDGVPVIEVFGTSGAASIYKRTVFQQAGGFDERFFCYFEDVDLALRLRARGHFALLVTEAKGRHHGGHSTGSLPGFALVQTSRNVICSILKSAPLPLLPIILTMHVSSHAWFQYRNSGTALARYRSQGFWAGVKAMPYALASRMHRRPYPLGASWRVARRLSWRMKAVSRRSPRFWEMPEP